MQSTLDGDKDFGEESSGRNNGRSGIDGDAFVIRVMIESLAEKTFDQRLDGREGVNNRVIFFWSKSLKRQRREQVLRLRMWVE